MATTSLEGRDLPGPVPPAWSAIPPRGRAIGRQKSTIDALARLAPDVIVPTHCTGWDATHAISAALPDAFIQNSVGTRHEPSSRN